MPDITIENHGTIVLLRPMTPEGTAWVDEHLTGDHLENEVLTWGNAVVCEPRFVGDILAGMIGAGLSVEV